MEEEKDPSPEYIKAFNNGYRLQQHEPELLKKFITGNETSEQIKAGQQQYEREHLIKALKDAKQYRKDKEQER